MFKKTSLLWSFEVVEFCLVFPAAVRHFEHSFQSYSTRGDTPSYTFRAEKRPAQASAHLLSQAQGGLFCVLTMFVCCWSSE